MSEIEIINIEMKYPTSKFEMIYNQVLKLAQKYENQIRISIFINGITITGNRFRYDENIYSVLLGNDIKDISSANVCFCGTGGGSFWGCSKLSHFNNFIFYLYFK